MMRVYIAGPISADPSRSVTEKKMEFARVKRELRAARHIPVNPLEIEPDCGLTPEECRVNTNHPDRKGQGQHSWECYMRADLQALLTCDAICLLPGWALSPGAVLEQSIALALGMRVVTL